MLARRSKIVGGEYAFTPFALRFTPCCCRNALHACGDGSNGSPFRFWNFLPLRHLLPRRSSQRDFVRFWRESRVSWSASQCDLTELRQNSIPAPTGLRFPPSGLWQTRAQSRFRKSGLWRRLLRSVCVSGLRDGAGLVRRDGNRLRGAAEF